MVESILRFIDYKVIDISYNFADENVKENGEIDLPISLTRKLDKSKDGKFKLSLILTIGNVEKNSPFMLNLTLAGLFEVSEQNKIDEMAGNATAILYPYLRNIVSGVTSLANIAPLTLPVVNINKMFEDEEKNK